MKTTPLNSEASSEVQDVDRCVKCGDNEVSDGSPLSPLPAGLCQANISRTFGDAPIVYCGCKCVFPSPSVSEAEDKNSGEGRKEHRGVPRTESKATSKLKAAPCKSCASGQVPTVLDEDGTLASLSGKQGVLSHASGEYWWPCSRYGLAYEGPVAWQPIETAPRDGERVLLANTKGVTQGYWDCEIEAEGGQCWRESDPDMQRFEIVFGAAPTRWIPLPATPNFDVPERETETRLAGLHALPEHMRDPNDTVEYARIHQPPEQNLEDKNSGGRCTCGHRCPSKQEWMDGAQCVHAEDCELMQTKASSRSTDRIPKDISLTLAEIQQKQDGRRAETRADAEYIADIDTLLSIIDTLQRAIPLAAFEFHKIDGRIAESISQCAASNMKAELIKRVREEMSGFTPESIERFAAKLEAVELTQDTESSKASHNPEVSVSESTLVTAPDVQAADVPVQPPNALKELLNRYTVPCPNDCEHSQCPLLRELQAIAENSRIVDVLAKAQETVKPIVDAEKESENVGDLMNVRLHQSSPVQVDEVSKEQDNDHHRN